MESGHLIGGCYELLSRMGRGSFGEVWKARERAAADLPPVAIKFLERAEDLPGEIRVAAQLDHPHILRYRHTLLHEEYVALVMDLALGGSVADLLRTRTPRTPEETAAIIGPVARALAYMHSRTPRHVHRDIKPGNILLMRPFDGLPDGVRLGDFGTVRKLQASLQQVTRVGTLQYMAPEIIAREQTGPPMDVYSLGVTAYHLLRGDLDQCFLAPEDLPAEAPGESPALQEAWPFWRELLAACLQKKPADRISAEEVAERLHYLETPEARRLRQEQQALEQDRRSLELHRRDQQREQDREWAGLEQSREQLEAEREELRREQASLQAGLKTLLAERKSLEARQKQLQAEWEALRGLREKVHRDLDAIHDQEQQLEHGRREQLQESSRSLGELTVHRGLLDAEREQLRQEQQALEEEQRRLEEERRALETEREDQERSQKAELRKLAARWEDLQEQLEQERESLEAQREEGQRQQRRALRWAQVATGVSLVLLLLIGLGLLFRVAGGTGRTKQAPEEERRVGPGSVSEDAQVVEGGSAGSEEREEQAPPPSRAGAESTEAAASADQPASAPTRRAGRSAPAPAPRPAATPASVRRPAGQSKPPGSGAAARPAATRAQPEKSELRRLMDEHGI